MLALVEPLRPAVRELNPDLTVAAIRAMESLYYGLVSGLGLGIVLTLGAEQAMRAARIEPTSALRYE